MEEKNINRKFAALVLNAILPQLEIEMEIVGQEIILASFPEDVSNDEMREFVKSEMKEKFPLDNGWVHKNASVVLEGVRVFTFNY